MPRGLPASYIKKAKRELGKGASWHDVFKRAWQLYKGSKVYKAVSNPGNPRKKSKKSKGGRKVAKKKRRRRLSFTIPLAPVAGLAAGLAEPIQYLIKGDTNNAINHLVYNYTGIPNAMQGGGNWDPNGLKKGLLPLVIGLLIHKLVGGPPLNLNRALGRARVPLIRI